MAGESIYRKLILVEADTSGLQKLDRDTKKAQEVLNQMGFATEKVSKVTEGATQVTSKFGKITTQSMYNIQTESGKTFQVMVKGGQQATSMMGDFERAMKRVLIVVPIWFIFRQAFMGVIRGFSDGLRQIEEFSRAFTKAKAVIHDAGMSMKEAFEVLEEKVRNLSITTGEHVEKLLSVFYRFGTVGVQFDKAMRGMEASTKLAMATQGDADETAKSFALAFQLLGHTINEAIPEQERELSVSAKMYKLWQINAFEQNEFNEALRQFLPVANTMNLTLDQTITLLASLHSAGLKGSQAGTLLRTSFMKFIEALPEIGEKLGIKVVPEKIGVYGALMEVLNKLKEIKEAGKLEELEGYFEDLFGGIRGAQPARALVAVLELVNKNSEITLSDMEKLIIIMQEFDKRIDDVTDSTFKLLEKNRNLRKYIWEAFIIGIVGGKNFDESLKEINETMESAIDGVKIFGEAIRDTWKLATVVGYPYIKYLETVKEKQEEIGKLQDRITMAMQGKLNYGQLQGLESEIKFTPEKELGGLNRERLLETLNLLIKKKEEQIKLEVQNEEKLKEQKQQIKEQGVSYDGIVKQIERELMQHEDKIKYLKMELQGATDLEIANQKLVDRVQELVAEYNKLTEQGKPVAPLDTAKITEFIQARQYGEILKLTNNRILNEKTIQELAKIQFSLEQEQAKAIATINEKEKERISIEQTINKAKIEGNLTTEQLLELEIWLIEKATYFNTAKEKELALLQLRNKLEIEHINNTKDITNKEKEQIDMGHQLNILKNAGILNSIQLIDYEKQLVDQSKYAYTEHEKKLKLYELEKEKLEEIVVIVGKYGEEFKSSFQGGLKDLLLNETDVGGFFTGIQQNLRNMWAESMSKGLTDAFFGATGIGLNIGKIFGGIETGKNMFENIENAHYEGILQGAQIIRRAHIEGMSAGASGMRTGVAGAGGGFGGIDLANLNLPNWMPFNQKLGNNMGSYWNNMNWMQGLTGFGMGAMAGGQTGGFGGAMTGGLSSLFMMAGHPILGALFALPAMFGLFNKKKSWTKTEVQESLNQVPSKIDITNKQLAMVNRNLVALRQELSYIMPKSYYFSERDRFSIDISRGEQ